MTRPSRRVVRMYVRTYVYTLQSRPGPRLAHVARRKVFFEFLACARGAPAPRGAARARAQLYIRRICNNVREVNSCTGLYYHLLPHYHHHRAAGVILRRALEGRDARFMAGRGGRSRVESSSAGAVVAKTLLRSSEVALISNLRRARTRYLHTVTVQIQAPV